MLLALLAGTLNRNLSNVDLAGDSTAKGLAKLL